MIEVKIKHPRTGEVRVYQDKFYAKVPNPDREKFPYDLDAAMFMYTEGNYACDCNRSLFFSRAGGEPREPEDTSCGEDEYKIELWCDGVCFHSEFE